MYNVSPTEQVSQSFAHVDRHWPNHRWRLLGMHVFARSGYFSFSHTLETHWVNLHCTHAQYAFILNTVLLLYYYIMLYYIKTAWTYLYKYFIVFLFLEILYNKILYISCVLKWYIISIVVIHSNCWELTQRGV